MRPIQHLLSAQDYHVTNLDYPSRQLPIEALAELLAQVVEQEHDSDLPLFLVGYSMGGVLWRYVMQHYRPQGVEAVLQIGSPNHGSEIADRIYLCLPLSDLAAFADLADLARIYLCRI